MDPLYLSFSGGNITKALQVAHHCFDKYTLAFRFYLPLLARGGWEIVKLKTSVCFGFCSLLFAFYFSIS